MRNYYIPSFIFIYVIYVTLDQPLDQRLLLRQIIQHYYSPPNRFICEISVWNNVKKTCIFVTNESQYIHIQCWMWDTNFLHVTTDKKSLQLRITSISSSFLRVASSFINLLVSTSGDRENLPIETHLCKIHSNKRRFAARLMMLRALVIVEISVIIDPPFHLCNPVAIQKQLHLLGRCYYQWSIDHSEILDISSNLFIKEGA